MAIDLDKGQKDVATEHGLVVFLRQSGFGGPDAATMTWFRDALNEKGIIATIRASRGQDIDAACGLLSTKNLL